LLGDFNSRTADDPDYIEIFIIEHEHQRWGHQSS
jgi:hypothetical protein